MNRNCRNDYVLPRSTHAQRVVLVNLQAFCSDCKTAEMEYQSSNSTLLTDPGHVTELRRQGLKYATARARNHTLGLVMRQKPLTLSGIYSATSRPTVPRKSRLSADYPAEDAQAIARVRAFAVRRPGLSSEKSRNDKKSQVKCATIIATACNEHRTLISHIWRIA